MAASKTSAKVNRAAGCPNDGDHLRATAAALRAAATICIGSRFLMKLESGRHEAAQFSANGA
jgi:hypothetical protein